MCSFAYHSNTECAFQLSPQRIRFERTFSWSVLAHVIKDFNRTVGQKLYDVTHYNSHRQRSLRHYVAVIYLLRDKTVLSASHDIRPNRRRQRTGSEAREAPPCYIMRNLSSVDESYQFGVNDIRVCGVQTYRPTCAIYATARCTDRTVVRH